ncbi:MAG: NAD(P)/FAD-dependent oxidoreductase [Solirubrobacteraceae bacterium]
MVSISSSDVCVVGGGVIGLAAAASLLGCGVDVVCFDRSEPGQGQSVGRTRQFRHLHGSAELIELAVRARQGWLEWEGRFGRTLLGSEGALRAGGEPGELDALCAAGVPAVALDPELAQARLPVAVLPAASFLWDPLAGAIRASDTVQALSDWIGPRVSRTEVSSIAIHGDGESVDVLTASGVHRSARCLVCAGAGTDRLVRPLGLAVRQDRQAHLRLGFRTRVPTSQPLPCFSDRSGHAGEQIYALSDLGDRYAVGLAPVTTYPAVEDLAGEVPAGVSVAAQRDRIVTYVRRVLPGLDPAPVDAVLRLTTTLPSHPEDGFEVWRQGPVVAVAGPNLFKFAPVIGERLAAAVSEQQPLDGLLRPPPEIARTARGPRRSSR